MAPALAFIFWSFQIILIFSNGVRSFSWGGNKRISSLSSSTGPSSSREHLARTSVLESSKLPAMYSTALDELQELESEPLCHRIAARLLVNNCQLLDGRDDATILTDSGRAARDFVDSYAASLAICDLQRGSFAIPSVCSKFQESTLARIAPPTKPQLHVTTTEIDYCLEGLAQSDSAWNTWVSYRHKTLRFCEAARADNAKDQNVRLHQRLVDILARLTTQLEEEMGQRFRSLNQMFQEVETATANLKPQMSDLKNGFTELDTFFREQIVQRVQRSTDFIVHGLEDAKNLQILLAMLVDVTQTQNHDLVSSHESALQEATQRITTEVDVILSALAAAVTSSTSLHREIEISQSIAAAVALRQEKIETDMKRLEGLADSLLIQHEGHQERLVHAQQTASNLVDILDSASSSAATLRTSIYNSIGWGSWWPYVFCPLTSLVVGSYGLPPSATRNFMLISLGEIAGFVVSIAKHYGNDIHTAFTSYKKVPLQTNSTIALDEVMFSNDDFLNGETWRLRFNRNV
ncbi:uncharacterized protein TrAFT101_001400 [Trichoderma asperellum]|uniref:Nuclear membrane fusion protein Kar5 n=1 Tax=Trichoderma asperellum (strain ATCC 204424 / CBS 433.97 / NBRC 101777) TaxID=1042311 RepID=A0A2T3ZDD6_TRIA4|nr:hypothetical protein M441DRAFT_66586 [Trichoderma asperellum CBS 433.97]PTB42817.1 hypothetical protein M441DRAFT_66586 [Trichoderma asperellum CBS 433.97]UKZ85545.1 hypothetical protein TrAFT101_001400 [Trichoderma asperellum]